jgi:hypothetical protein
VTKAASWRCKKFPGRADPREPGRAGDRGRDRCLLAQPAFGQIRGANEMRKLGFSISPSGMRGVGLRHELETMKKRLKGREAKVAQDGSDFDRGAGRRTGENGKGGSRRVRRRVPGYCGAQDTCYVGTMKGVGRIYQQIFVIPIRR